jgi:hypothetical protein
MLSLKTSGLLSSALLIQSFVFQAAALELSQGELDGYLEGVAEFLMEEGERQAPPLPPPTPHHQQPPLNHRRNFTFRLPNLPEIEYADEQQLYSPSSKLDGLIDISYLEAMREQLPSLAGSPTPSSSGRPCRPC